ncbi:hypothetical protein [Mucilaginibacter pedocola]|uniref:Outer membrane protein beta-barrel domain-containing protein n=1 Tax=Mucilaginibacter pedocola TaxID=1792845 RepID=A0A1S9PGM5_9SPHI|nr:hypothetical protein [Mucilaginibacter pedocola]OOQ60114.1 hypothetical protein BC343_26705 [Mucilaginibacter pedocola]
MNKKTKLLAASLTALALFVGTRSNAQSIEKGKLRFGIGLDGLAPVGNFTKTANFGLGLTPRLQYGISNRFALTFTSGIYHFFPKDIYLNSGTQTYKTQWELNVVPVKVGFKAFVTQHIYLGAEGGIGFQVDNGGGDSKYLFSPSVGYASKNWDFSLRYENFSGNGYRNGVIGARIAYGFGL